MAEKLATFVAGLVVTTGGPVALSVVKVAVAAVTGAGAVGGYDSDMINGART